MRRRHSCFLQVASSLLVLQTALLAQHGGPTNPTTGRTSPARSFTPPAAPLLWGRSGQVNHPGTWPGGDRRHDNGRRTTGYRGPYPYFYGGLVPLGYGLPFAYDLAGDSDEQDSANSTPPLAQTGYTDQPSGVPADAGSEVAASAPPLFRPMYQGPIVAAPVHPQPATTLIFKDGRPPEQVHNYALTATTLYALDGEMRQEIPLSLLDVPATIAANHATGVDFALPISR
jgi:hypothetical protein